MRPRVELRRRIARSCSLCGLVFVEAEFHLSLEAERARYLLHQNSAADAEYVGFLETVITPVAKQLRSGASVLDFGSGPVPVLANLLGARGYDVAQFDPHFAPDAQALSRTYDAVFCCETVEHFREPLRDWTTLIGTVKPGGVLAVQTLLYDDAARFAEWWYTRDLTHVAFYSAITMKWLAQRFALTIIESGPRVTLFRNANGTP